MPRPATGGLRLIALIIFLQILPARESCLYESRNKDRTGTIIVESRLEDDGYHVTYRSDRLIEAVLDTADLSTRFLRKVIGQDTVLEITSGSDLVVHFNGRLHRYRSEPAVYDRHTLDFALRGFDYGPGFKTRFRLHIPELMVVNAELEVQGEAVIETPAGEFACWEVVMKPRIIFFKREFFFLIEKDQPRRFVKFTDASGQSSILLMRYEAGPQ